MFPLVNRKLAPACCFSPIQVADKTSLSNVSQIIFYNPKRIIPNGVFPFTKKNEHTSKGMALAMRQKGYSHDKQHQHIMFPLKSRRLGIAFCLFHNQVADKIACPMHHTIHFRTTLSL